MWAITLVGTPTVAAVTAAAAAGAPPPLVVLGAGELVAPGVAVAGGGVVGRWVSDVSPPPGRGGLSAPGSLQLRMGLSCLQTDCACAPAWAGRALMTSSELGRSALRASSSGGLLTTQISKPSISGRGSPF
eukprot:TRINITY_DN19553_c0_g1_i1.p1 TRINITY_DN19553_c0_g1~~TRINITY_DN19553_c0_g1_i1.p1  ORF type:complete len:131 (-),score=3.44 TRINITY_DN19553_c0_g1_i1:21-413(-)